MKKLTLDFYGEKIRIPFPNDFPSLSKEIDKNLNLNISDVFRLDISYTKNKIKKSIKSEDDYKLFILSKSSIINLEIVESKELFQNNSMNLIQVSKEEKNKLETLKKKRKGIKLEIEKKEREAKKIIDEYKPKLESLNHQKEQYLNKIQNNMKDQSKKEKELVIKIIELSKEINAPLMFKLPQKGPSPIKGETKKEKEYLELIKKYDQCLKIGEELFSNPRKNIDNLDKQIKLLYKKYFGKNKSSEEEIFELKNKENSISKEIENLEIKLGLIKKEPKYKDIDDLINNLGKRIKDNFKKNEIKTKEEIKRIREKIKKNEYELRDEEKELLEKIDKENKCSLSEIEKWIEFISNHSQELIDSLENKNALQLKNLNDLEKRIELSDSLQELTAGPGVEKIGAIMPYTRYDTDEATIGGGATIITSPNHLQDNLASQASKLAYITLPSSGAYAEWTMKTTGRGVTMRFTLPDTEDGMGQSGSLDVYVNNTKVKTVDLTSYFMWQYFPTGNPSDTPAAVPCFAFDETHFLLDTSLKVGDKIKIQSSGANNLEYGIDFIEVEEVGDPLPAPENSFSVVDYGAIPDDGQDDYNAIHACIAAADIYGKNVYFPPGTYHINQIWRLNCQNIKITGAGIWYTNIQFTNDQIGTGGISGGVEEDGHCRNIEFCHMYINSHLRSRYDQLANYKCFMDIFTNSFMHDIWEDHFEVGFWIADYSKTIDYSDGIIITNCRIRNNFADGVNFCQGTSCSKVYNCSIRNNGDDGLAMWNDFSFGAKDEKDNVFCYNTIDFIWRAGAIAVYGGTGHKVYNNYVRDTHMSSGIHLNTTFPGYKFNNNKGILFANNVLIKTGSVKGCWEEEFGAVDLDGDVKNITFTNTYIYDAQHDGIHLGKNNSNIVFNNLYIYGAGTDGQQGHYLSSPHYGAAIMIYSPIQSCTINNLTLANIASKGTQYESKTVGNYINLKNVTINGEKDLDKTPYEYPTEPKVGTITVDGFVPGPDPKVSSFEKLTHHGIVCSGCGNSIDGIRYKCSICHEFDYCEKCEGKDKGGHGHPFLKITRPELCPTVISCKLNH